MAKVDKDVMVKKAPKKSPGYKPGKIKKGILGSGAAQKAANLLKNRGRTIEDAVKDASFTQEKKK